MMKSNVSNAASLILLLMAASSLLSMIGLTQIDRIVHRDLYRFSLQFSYEWAMPYWTMTAIVFGMGWFNIIVAIAFQLYILISRRREAEVSMIRAEATRFETPSIPISVESKQPEEAPTPSVEIEQKPEENLQKQSHLKKNRKNQRESPKKALNSSQKKHQRPQWKHSLRRRRKVRKLRFW